MDRASTPQMIPKDHPMGKLSTEVVIQPDHLQADEYPYEGQTVLQQMKTFDSSGEQEFKRSEAEDRQHESMMRLFLTLKTR